MSRIAKYPIPLPKGVDLTLASGSISVKGPLGTIARPTDPNVEVKQEGEQVVFKALGISHPVVHQMPKGIKVATPTQTEIVITGIDKQLVGQVAAEVRAQRSPEPYKGKGVRYTGEVIVLKETKKK